MTLNDTHIMTNQQPCIILCTTNSYESAMKITQSLLNNRLAACVSLLPEIISLYLWEEKITQNKEILLLIKTMQTNQIKLFEMIKEIHPYTVPELIRLDQNQVEDNYLQWLINSIK
ncbi:divalent-cation tolerance protein CutA [Providencia sp. Je.9.19]|uniref:divalent-cation tolerance protein CutA n=1 Tax=Providencia sp. Je.9.19 TaxID=3142844 RepID=UPI003DA83B8F